MGYSDPVAFRGIDAYEGGSRMPVLSAMPAEDGPVSENTTGAYPDRWRPVCVLFSVRAMMNDELKTFAA
jgi:hypothetical protein